ncbi:MAG: sensor histidine kinase, partial [Anaerolineales bacterium]
IDSRLQQGLVHERGQQLAVLQERQRLARELHDSVTQLIFSTTLIAQSITPAWKRDPVEGQRRLDRLLELSQTALREMRSMLFELRPSDETQRNDELMYDQSHAGQKEALTGPERVRRFGLLDAIRQLAGDFSHDGIEIRVDGQGFPLGQIASGATKESSLEPVFGESLYRIVQESISNAIKHARARQVFIQIGSESNKLCLSIKDDGVGFIPRSGEESKAGGFGMNNMRERAEALGGSLQIISVPGEGTRVEVMIPIREI